MRIRYLAGYIFIGCFLASCGGKTADKAAILLKEDMIVDTSVIPKDTVVFTQVRTNIAGIITYRSLPFSGHVFYYYPDRPGCAFASVYKGNMHGIYRSFYGNGALHEVRQYKNNLSTGRHYGFWPNGKMQFDYLYYKDRKIGYMKKWYETGKPYMSLNYVNDHEEGLQQGWRGNGKLFLNYIAKDGHRYGLQESMLCYKLDKNGEVIK